MAALFTLVESGGLVLVRCAPLKALAITHAITTRLGGTSEPPFHTLNMGLHTGDKPEDVVENRRRACAALGVSLESLVAGEQVHGTAYHVVTRHDAGRGAKDERSALPATDILLTQTPGIMLASFYADCVPVLLADAARRAVGVVHCGWRGTWREAIRIAVAAMEHEFAVRPAELVAVMGPSIGPCCYEVSAELAGEFRRRFGEDVAAGNRLDLRLANVRTLTSAGVLPPAIHVAPWCTSCQQQLFFSHRGSGGRTGRLAVLLGL